MNVKSKILHGKKLGFVFVALLSLFPGCGGGSSGTGVQSYDGRIISTLNAPLAGASVELVGSGSGAITDSSGNFAFDTSPVDGDPSLRIRGSNFDTSAVIPGVEASTRQVSVVVRVNIARNEAEAIEVNVSRSSSSSSRSSVSSQGSSSSSGGSSNSSEDDDDSSSQGSVSSGTSSSGSSSSSSDDDDDDDDDDHGGSSSSSSRSSGRDH